ncbi:MAG: flagellar basal body-associated protein FliL [Oceanospirillaceae bacterium]|nr:flagellar basal body-associated protein FliL [Oceanospirillaceae bacterium]|tara:strand:- start:22119 stop:22532 length:414 start_codon:yes stop_codon:yes gene_type:complete
MFRRATDYFFLVSALLLALTVRAEDELPVTAGTEYVKIEPAIVVNYGSSGRMKYLRTEIALKVTGGDAADAVKHHKPYIRNKLVLLFSAQDSDTMNSSEGRESLRKVALDEVRALMVQLEDMPYIDDLYFSSFVVQN